MGTPLPCCSSSVFNNLSPISQYWFIRFSPLFSTSLTKTCFLKLEHSSDSGLGIFRGKIQEEENEIRKRRKTNGEEGPSAELSGAKSSLNLEVMLSLIQTPQCLIRPVFPSRGLIYKTDLGSILILNGTSAEIHI